MFKIELAGFDFDSRARGNRQGLTLVRFPQGLTLVRFPAQHQAAHQVEWIDVTGFVGLMKQAQPTSCGKIGAGS